VAHHESSEPVVVAEYAFARANIQVVEFSRRNRIVFVDDGQNAKFQKRFHRLTEIRIAAAIDEISLRQQHLSELYAVRLKQFFIFVHQQALSDGRTCLPHHEIIQPVAMKSHPSPAQADRSGRHEHNLAAVLLQRGDGSGYWRKMLEVKMTISARHNPGAELDHRAASRAQPLLLLAFWMLICHGTLLYHRPALIRKLCGGCGVVHFPIFPFLKSWPPEPCSLAVGEARWDELCLSL